MAGQRSKLQEDVHFRILRLLQQNPELSQRELAEAVGISVGSAHYILNALVEKGLIKFENFTASKDKRRYAYILTPDGFSEKARLTVRFLRRKMVEYDALKDEISELKSELETQRGEGDSDVLETLRMGRKQIRMKKTALVTGITGQDGAYLTQLLLAKGYEVHGIKRRSSSFNTGRIDHLYQDPHEANVNLKLHYGDMTDATNLIRVVQEVQPDEIYNLAAQSHVQVSFETAEYTANADALGTLRLLEAIRLLGLKDRTRFYQASTSELYGKVQEIPQSETTPFYPRSPYGAAKLYAYWITVNYREAYGIHASNGILFNHESPIRGETFVTRKITRAVAAIKLGLQDRLYLGNLDAERDWGHARDYVEGMWRILQRDEADDYVLATGEKHSVRAFVEAAFKEVGLSVSWQGDGLSERGIDASTGRVLVEIDPRYFRPAEVDLLIGDPSKARRVLGWQSTTSFEDMVTEMVKSDLDAVTEESRHRRLDEEHTRVAAKQSMKISVITVAYNSAETIAYTLESFLAQDHENKEMILIDGASSDTTLAIASSFGSDRILVISEADSGMYDALNKGLVRYSGDAVGVLNSDDTYHDKFALSRIDEALTRADIVHGHLDFVEDHVWKRPVRRWRAESKPDRGFRTGWMPAHPTFYVRRTVAERVGAFDISLKTASDYDWMLRAVELHDHTIGLIDHILIDMQQGGKSTNSLCSHVAHNLEALQARRRWLNSGLVDYALVAKPTRKIGQFIRRGAVV